MRFRKGDRVEVMNTKEVPISWRVAEILSGNGHIYRVKYPGMASEKMVEMVSIKFLRPCPSEVKGFENCIAGDIIEVFHEFSWKIATMVKVVVGKNETKSNKVQYLVRLLGCSQELVVDKSNIRMRQTWIDDQWFLMGKGSRGGLDDIANNASTLNRHQNMNLAQSNAISEKKLRKDRTNVHHKAEFRRSPIISSRSLKRVSPYDSTIIEEHNRRAKKVRAIEKDGRKKKMVPTPLLEIGYNRTERGKVSDIQTESNSSDSDACSVGSCSITNQSRSNYYIPFIHLPCQETETVGSDAESYNGSGPPKEEIEVSVRGLELNAYRRTLEALYASGSLSWEQEALLTNLRIMLHISNDEHLMEVKHLISAKNAIHVR